jgi:hypothetical protein
VIRPGYERLCCGVLGLVLALSGAACSGGGGQNSVASGKPNATPQGIAPDSGTATLNWTPAVQNTNGTALTDLAGYKIHFGTSPDALSTVVVIANPGATTHQVTNLSSGTWYFAVAAYTSTGAEGVLSNVASKTIQ